MSSAIRVLLTDDERPYADALAKVLARRGMAVRVAYDGAGAITAFAAEPPDVVLLDLRMPGMDGVATLQELRRRDGVTPVLLVSAHADAERAAAALELGATDYLFKPCPVDELVAAIEDACERTAYAREADALASEGRNRRT